MRSRTLLATTALVCGLAATAGAQAAPDRAELMKQHRGGTLKLTAHGSAGTIDPAINYTLEFLQVLVVTNDGLLTFRKVGGKPSNDVVADIAEEVPKPQDGGKTYVFKIRRGITFSNGRELTPTDVAATFTRIFKVSSPTAGSFYNGIVGADACLKTPDTCSLKDGVVADDKAGTVTFHLTDPDADFFYKMAFDQASILPADTPAKDLGTVPAAATGPYMIESYNPDRVMHIVRNPHFKEWSADAQPDGYVDAMDYNFGLDDQAGLTAVENGQDDWTYDAPPPDRLNELSTKFAKQVHVNSLLAYYFASMNVNEAPFNNLKVRQAVNYAVDRKAIVSLWGGPNLATPICQFIPAGMPGYEPYCPYTLNPGDNKWSAPDVAKAKQLIDESGTKGAKVTLIASDRANEKAVATYLQGLLTSLGYDASLKTLSHNIQTTYIQNSNNHVQISLTDWFQDYPSPADFIDILFGCDSFHPGSDASPNESGWCDKPVDAAIKKAEATAVTDPAAALKLWAVVDRQVTDAAPAAALFQPRQVDFVSKRLGNYMFSDQLHMIFSQAWVQ
jgi:peptide/nickel transport system substrate-binding protein